MKKKNSESKRLNSLNTKKTSQRLLLSKESVEDEFEIDLIDEDEQYKTPLIKETSNNNNNNLNKLPKDEEMEEEEERNEINRFSKQPSNTPPPITIGKIKIFNPGKRQRALRLRRIIKRCCTLIFVLLFLLLLLCNINRLPEIFQILFSWLDKSAYPSTGSNRKDFNSHCEQVVSSPVWRQNFPMLTIESALRIIDVNNDTVLDVVVPFGTGIDAAYYDQTLCQIYFNQTEEESKSMFVQRI